MRKTPIVAVNGCFDIIHPGHIKLLEFAAQFGELYVLINDDEGVKALKGEHKPYMRAEDRAAVLMGIKGVKSVMIFSTQSDLSSLYRFLAPDYIVVGDEYRTKRVVGSEYAGKLVFFKKIPGYSSTSVVERITKCQSS